MDPVGLAATIGGSLVGLAGVAATAWSNRLQQVTAREPSERQQAHERDLARGARLFERRAPVYEEMLRLLYPWMERVDATEPIMRFAGEPEPPEPPDREEWRAMQVRLRTYGSVAVADAYRDFADALWSFFAYVPSVRAIKERGTDAGDTVRVHEEFEEARLRVREALRSLERLVSDELAAL